VLARLDPQDEQNGLRSAQANLAAAQGQLTQARNNFERQRRLLERGVASRAEFDHAQKGLQTAQARVDDAEAQLKLASDRLSFTELKADATGTVTARGAEAGEVVQAGQMIVRIARQDGRTRCLTYPPNCCVRRRLTQRLQCTWRKILASQQLDGCGGRRTS
jgi:membrane fusion protein, multidrug efflux system